MSEHRSELKAPWNKDYVIKFILDCREDGGIPMFRTKYAGIPIEYAGTRAVIGICWGGRGNAPDSILLYDVPKDVVKELEREKGDWKYLLMKYGDLQELISALEKPVVLHSYKETADLLKKLKRI